MKRVFILLSNLLVSLFLVWVITIWSDTYVSYYYPSVAVMDASSDVSFDEVAERLERLAQETDSVIAIQHQETGPEGKAVFSYTTFGTGKLPEGLTERSLEASKNSSTLTNYFIFNGHLDLDLLRTALNEVGLTRIYLVNPTFFTRLASVFGNGFQLIGLLIFFLTFGALSLISQIRALRTAGIRLISGESRWRIFVRPLTQDLINASIGLVASLILVISLKTVVSVPLIVFYSICASLVLYNLLLLAISLFFTSLFAIGIKKVHLMQVIKGQIPVRGIISLILIGQLLAVIIVAIGVSRTLIYSQAFQQQDQGHEFWQKENQLVALSFGREAASISYDEETIEKQKTWYQVIDQAVEEQNAILSRHYLVEQGMQSSQAISSFHENYEPEGNVVIVTPDYLKRQKITVAPEIEEKINQLDVGEFVLLLPDKLHSDETHYKTVFEDYITNIMASEDSRQEMRAIVSYVETGYQRFVYNTTPLSYQQFLSDPIIIVLTPHSTGQQSYSFWEASLQSYFFFDNLEDTQSLIAKHGLGNWISELQTGYHIHQTLLDNIEREVWVMTAGAILGILTSILLFHTMNQLYFEEFRRDILIKRIAGLRFLEIHRNYLLAQIAVFFLGCLGSVFLATDIMIAFLVLLLFIGISVMQLSLQMKKENQMSMLILKGA
ncbi:bacteriocin-associated integral membrane family protein [Streptococcus marimammalium]|uniref:bacteriocin-associated integral membrane family protein n=1 Tax=Streptococcus marimammalium TaxID=269666 RepID=UPI0003780D7D|nr:DUF1430 domain-containing protein [Streptococcus marimammalium]